MVLWFWATSANPEANCKEYFPDAKTESIHRYSWINGRYLQLMPIWMVWMNLLSRNKTQTYISYVGHWLGPTQRNDNEMCQSNLHMNVQVIPGWSLFRLHPDEFSPYNESEAHKRASFDEAIRENIGDLMTPPKLTTEEKPQTLEFIPDNDEQQGSIFSGSICHWCHW